MFSEIFTVLSCLSKLEGITAGGHYFLFSQLEAGADLGHKAPVMSTQAASMWDFRMLTLGWGVRQAFLSTLP